MKKALILGLLGLAIGVLILLSSPVPTVEAG